MSDSTLTQPLHIDEFGTIRFKRNSIVQFLLDAGPFDMHTVASLPNIPKEDRASFAQLTGVSVGEFCEMRCVPTDMKVAATEAADNLLKEDA